MSRYKSFWTEWNTEKEGIDLAYQWHTMPENRFIEIGRPRLYRYLGMTWEEYANWTLNGTLTEKSDESRMEP